MRAAAVEAQVEDPSTVELVYLPEAKGLLEQLTSLQTRGMAASVPPVLFDAIEPLRPFTSLDAGIHVITDAVPTIK